MSAVQSVESAQPGGGSQEQRVSALELFFDLVFVPTQVTVFLASDLTWGGGLRGTAP